MRWATMVLKNLLHHPVKGVMTALDFSFLSLRSLHLSLLALHDHSDEQKTLKASHPSFEGFTMCGVLSQIQKDISNGLGFPGTLMSSWEDNSQTFGILGNVHSIK